MRFFSVCLLLCAALALGASPNPGSENLYERLGVSPRATRDAIVDAYVSFMRGAGHSAESIRRVTEAHDVLTNTDRRLVYDTKTADTPILSNSDAVDGTKEVIAHLEQAIALVRSVEVLRYEYAAAVDGPAAGSDRPRYVWSEKWRKVLDLVFRDRALAIYRQSSDPVVRAEALCFVSEIHRSPMDGLAVSLHAEDLPLDPVFEARLRVLAPALDAVSQLDWARALLWHETYRQARRVGDRETADYVSRRVLPRLITHPEVRWSSTDEAARRFLVGLIATDYANAAGVYTFVRLLEDDGHLLGYFLKLIRSEVAETVPRGWMAWCGETLQAVWHRVRYARRSR